MKRVGRWARRGALPLVKILITTGLLAYVSSGLDMAAVLRAAGRADAGRLALAVATLFPIFLLGGLRWWCVVKGLGQVASARQLIGPFWIGGLVSQLLPNPIGDAVRVSLATKHGLRLGTAIRSTAIERVVMIVALLFLMATTEAMLRARVGDAVPTRLAWVLLGGGLGALIALAIADRLVVFLRGLPFLGSIAALSAEFRRLLASIWSIPVYATAMLGHVDLIVSAAIVGTALDLPLTVGDYFAIMPVAMVAMVLPVSFGGWGVREGVLVAILAAMGVQVETALAFSLLFGIACALSSLPGLAFLRFDTKARALPQKVPGDGPTHSEARH